MARQHSANIKLDWLISHFRWVWLAVILLVIFVVQPAPANITAVYLVMAVGLVYNLLVVILLAVKWYPDWFATLSIIVDTIVAIMLMLLTGGHNSIILFALLFPVVTAVIRLMPESGLLIAAMPIALAYVVSLFLQQDLHPDSLLKVGTNLLALFGAGLLAGYLSSRKEQVRVERDDEEIRKLRIDKERAQAIYEMANTLSSTLNYRKVLHAMVDLAQLALAEASGNPSDRADVDMVLLFEQDSPLGKLKLVAGRNVPRHDEQRQVSAQAGLLAQVVYKAEALIGNNVQNDPILKNFMALHSCNSAVCAPLRAGFDVYGVVLFASPQQNIYTQEHASLLTTFCNQAIIALQNAQLYADLEREQRKLLEKEAQSRRELARNLHDGPTQAVAAMAMRLNFIQILIKKEGASAKAMDELHKIEQIALHTTKEIRTMLFTLRPIILETQGLGPALQQYAERLRDLDNLNIELDVDKYHSELATEEEGVIFTIIEEAIGNAKKYAKAKVIHIRLVAYPDLVVAEVADNGVGFDVNAVKAGYDTRGSLGLLNMEERAQMLHGLCYIKSEKGKGTSVKIEVPLKQN